MKHLPIIIVCAVIAYFMCTAFAWATGPNAHTCRSQQLDVAIDGMVSDIRAAEDCKL